MKYDFFFLSCFFFPPSGTVWFISISPAFTSLPRSLSVSVGLQKMGLTQERNTFTAPFSFDVIRNSIPSKWVFRISQQSLKMSHDPLLSRAAHASPSPEPMTPMTCVFNMFPLFLESHHVHFLLTPSQRPLWSLQGNTSAIHQDVFSFNHTKGVCQIFARILNCKCRNFAFRQLHT